MTQHQYWHVPNAIHSLSDKVTIAPQGESEKREPLQAVPLECVAFLLAGSCCCCTLESVGMMGMTCGLARVGNHSVHCRRACPRGEDSINTPPAMSCFVITTGKVSIDRLTCAGQTRLPGGIEQSGSDDVVPVVQPAATNAFARHGMHGVIALQASSTDAGGCGGMPVLWSWRYQQFVPHGSQGPSSKCMQQSYSRCIVMLVL
jgi:hypothetical protein